MTSLLYVGGVGAVSTLCLASAGEVASSVFPLTEGVGASAIILLLWAVKILKEERDVAVKNLALEQKKTLRAELKCLNCDYLGSHKLLLSVLSPERISPTPPTLSSRSSDSSSSSFSS